MTSTVLHVEGMTCSHCKKAVESALKILDGVNEASVDLESKTVSIDYEPGVVNEEALKKNIMDAGYDVK